MAKTTKKPASTVQDKETNFRSASHDRNDKESITSIKAAKKQNEVTENQAGNSSVAGKKK